MYKKSLLSNFHNSFKELYVLGFATSLVSFSIWTVSKGFGWTLVNVESGSKHRLSFFAFFICDKLGNTFLSKCFVQLLTHKTCHICTLWKYTIMRQDGEYIYMLFNALIKVFNQLAEFSTTGFADGRGWISLTPERRVRILRIKLKFVWHKLQLFIYDSPNLFIYFKITIAFCIGETFVVAGS